MASASLEPLCHARATELPPFGRVLELLEPVAAGDVIVCEAPAILMHEPPRVADGDFQELVAHWTSAYAGLSGEQRAFAASFTGIPESGYDRLSAELPAEVDLFRRVVKINSHKFGADEIAMFEHISMAAHSCEHNAVYISAQGLGLGRLYAISDLARGELVTISYVGSRGCVRRWPFWKRQEHLARRLGFACRCRRCEQDAAAPPSKASLTLHRAHEACVQVSRDFQLFEPRVVQHLASCLLASARDDGPLHLLRASDLARKFYNDVFRQTAKCVYLLPAIRMLAQKYRIIAGDASVMEDDGLGGLFSAGSDVLRRRPDAKCRAALERLWSLLGGQVRTCWGAFDPDFHHLCGALGEPGDCPSVEGIVAELDRVSGCSSCGIAAVLACKRCGKSSYCSAECQRADWPQHKPACQSCSAPT